MARLIGNNRREAIDWTQDALRTTRPLAEAVVTSLLEDRMAVMGDSGVVLFESDDELRSRHRQSFNMGTQKRLRFHAIRKYNKSRHTKARKIQMDWNAAHDAAQGMIDKEADT